MRRTVRVVVLDILGKDHLEVTSSEDEHPIEALAPQRTDRPLANGVRPKCPGRGLDDPDALGPNDLVEEPGELGVLVHDLEALGLLLLEEDPRTPRRQR